MGQKITLITANPQIVQLPQYRHVNTYFAFNQQILHDNYNNDILNVSHERK